MFNFCLYVHVPDKSSADMAKPGVAVAEKLPSGHNAAHLHGGFTKSSSPASTSTSATTPTAATSASPMQQKQQVSHAAKHHDVGSHGNDGASVKSDAVAGFSDVVERAISGDSSRSRKTGYENNRNGDALTSSEEVSDHACTEEQDICRSNISLRTPTDMHTHIHA